MRLRNRKALQDKTPRNSPQPAKRRSPASKQTLASKHIPSPRFPKPHLPTPTEDAEEARETPGPASERDLEQVERELSLGPSATASARKTRRPIHSTPLVVSRRKTTQSVPQPRLDQANLPPTPRAHRVSSPLPPSSPPSDFEFTRARISAIPDIPRVDEEWSPSKLQVYRDPEPTQQVQEQVLQRQPSSDDPFGFLAVERKLKAQRAARKHPHRVPVPAPAFKVLARDSCEERVVPVPLRSDDDDLYLDQDPEAEAEADKENIPLSVHSDGSLQRIDADVVEDTEDEDKENDFGYVLSSEIHPRRAREEEGDDHPAPNEEQELPLGRRARSSTEDTYDPLRTPHAAHVSKEIYPIRSPFSSRSTPCDREMAIDSAPSSPSPTKPLQFATPLQTSTSARPTKRLNEFFDKARGKRPAQRNSDRSPTAKKPRLAALPVDVEIGSTAVDSEDPLRRIIRRSARNHNLVAGPSATRSNNATRNFVKRVDHDSCDDEEGHSSGSVIQSDGDYGKVQGKEKGAAKLSKPDARLRTFRRGRKASNAQSRLSNRAKGKRKAQEIEDEDEEAAEARRARIEYFKKLDSDYSLAKENVYVV